MALYQDKEVDYLVATDAIGMGLNMDVNHVGFAGLSKFDGSRPRRLTAPEVAQIAGRAGRGMRDGTFGTTATCPELSEDVVAAVEAHRFDPLEQIFWRNGELDFTSPDLLLASLLVPPPRRGLIAGNEAADLQTLDTLAREPDIRRLASSRSATRLLWEACQIPDFRKLGDDSHTRLCARVFTSVINQGRLPTDWLATQIAQLSRSDGDIDTLMQRLSGVRVCSYIAARRDWLDDAPHWQAKAREVEDLLSDALHERLTARFVDRRAALLFRRLDETGRPGHAVRGHQPGRGGGRGPLGRPRGGIRLPARPAGGGSREALGAARRAPGPARGDAAPGAGAGHCARCRLLAVGGWRGACSGLIPLGGRGAPVARLRPGAGLLRPMVEVLDSEFLDGSQRERVRARLQAWLNREIEIHLAPLFEAQARAQSEPLLRGLLHRLVEEGGLVGGPTAQTIPPLLRQRLKPLGIRAGRLALFVPALLKPRPASLRAALLAVRAGVPVPPLPLAGAVSVPRHEGATDGSALLAALGWVPAGPVWLRLDVAERIMAEIAWLTRDRPAALPAELASRLSVRAELLPAVLRGLEVRLRPAAPLPAGYAGPPCPPLMSIARRREPASPGTPRQRVQAVPPDAMPGPRPDHDGPFAALASLRGRR